MQSQTEPVSALPAVASGASATPAAGRFGYPVLRQFTPVLSRGPGELQIGIDQQGGLVLANVAPAMTQVLALLDGCHHVDRIFQEADDACVPADSLAWTLRTLDDAGLLREGRGADQQQSTSLVSAQVRLVGAGRLGRVTAELLMTTDLGVLHIIDNQVADHTLYPGMHLTSQAEALRSSLPEPARVRVRVANHWSKPEDTAPDLTIIAGEEMECDRLIADHLMRLDQPHLVVSARAGGVVIGPLVLPGRSACLRCTDLVRRDADPGWPTLLPQLQRLRAPVTAALAGWAGGVAVAQALALLQGVLPETCGATLEITPADYLMHRRTWAMHASCGCGWQPTAQWEA